MPALLALIGILMGVAEGCSPRRMMIAEVGRIVEAGQPAYEQETDLYLLSRSFPSHFKLLEALSISDPQNTDLSVLIARMYGGYAFAILETELEALRYRHPPVVGLGLSPDQVAQHLTHCFQTGAEVALAALAARHPAMHEAMQTAQGTTAFFASLGRADVPALFWYGFNLAGYIQHNLHSVKAMSLGYRVENAMQRVLELDPAYNFYTAHLVLMAYYASPPPMMGGKPELAMRHYERHCLAMPQPMRLRELFRARYLLVREQQRDTFIRIMTELSAEVPRQTPMALLDSVAAHRARVYVNAVDYFFD